jgi:hypothetical protein
MRKIIGQNRHREEEGDEVPATGARPDYEGDDDDDIAYIESLSRSKEERKIFSTL